MEKKSATLCAFPLLFLNLIQAFGYQNSTRDGRAFSIFQVVTFPNDICSGEGAPNGTCYTSAECTSKGGAKSGTCAQGFGVCCIFSLSCGQSSSENCTYITQSSTSSPASDPCQYTICKCSSNICRIRLDFDSFSIGGPTTGSVHATAPLENNGGAIGDCTTDSFSLTSPGNPAPPLICGFNSGQHMIVDASDDCHKAVFDFSGHGTDREYNIKVIQYACGDELGGPDTCLQYFTGSTGKIASFNFPTTSTTITSTVTHLSNQCYTMCFRQELGKCAICFNTVIVGGTAVINQGSFGLSTATAATADARQDEGCSQDYLQIPGAEEDGSFMVGTINSATHSRICGRFFNINSISGITGGTDNAESICTQQRPFRVIFKTDDSEATVGTVANTNEQALAPGGITGFYLNYALQDC